MNLETFRTVLDIGVLLFGLPLFAWRVWRKLDERLTEQDKRLIRIEYQLYENGGSSLKDQMNSVVIDVALLKAAKE